MQFRIRSFLGALLVLTGPALAQVPSSLPPNTVIGRTGIRAGPPQVIPFAELFASFTVNNVQPITANLTALLAMGVGCAGHSGATAWAPRVITGTTNEISVSNGNCVGGNPTISLATALDLAGKSVSGGTFASGTWQGNPVGTTYGGFGQSLASSTGIPAFSSGTLAFRTLTGTASEISVSNGTGASGNPTLGLPSSLLLTGKTIADGTFSNITISSAAGVTGLPAPTNASDAATKAYADGIASGTISIAASKYATAAVLPNSPTYANGASGVGATLTAGSNAAIVVDGATPSVSDVILVKNQASALQNGVYTVTTVGDGSNAYVLTRATYFDQAAEMLVGSTTLITAGSTNTGTRWALGATVATVGSTAANFNQVSNATIGGPATSTVSNMACWNNTTGSLTKDCGPLVPAITQYGATTGGSASANGTAITNAQAAFAQQYVNYGTFNTNIDFIGGALGGQWWGPGTLKDSDGHLRGRWLDARTAPVTSWCNYTSVTTWYDCDWSKSVIPIETLIHFPPVAVVGPFAGVVTNAGTAAANAVLHFSNAVYDVHKIAMCYAAGTPAALYVADATAPRTASITFATQVSSCDDGARTVTLTANVGGSGVSSGDEITFGVGQYLQSVESSPVNVYIYAAQDTLNIGASADVPAGAVTGQFLSAYNCGFINDAGGGGGNCFSGRVSVTRAASYYDPTNPANTNNVGVFAGIVNAEADNVWLDPLEITVLDNAHPSTAFGMVIGMNRTVAGTYDSQRWTGISIAGAASSSTPGDAVIKPGLWWKYGLDFTGSSITAQGPFNGRPAIALPEGQGIAFNATGTANGATSAGTSYIQRSTGSHRLFLTNANSADPAIEIDTSNNVFLNSASDVGNPSVGIGISSTPSGLLQIGPGSLTSSNNNLAIPFKPLSNNAMMIQAQTANTGNAANFINSSGSQVGSISMSTSATAYNTSSDRRLKRNVVAIGDSGAIIDKLQPVTFDWRASGGHAYGLIAQDAYRVFPDAVTPGDAGPAVKKAWQVDYSKFVPILLAEVKSLRAEVKRLKQRRTLH